MKRARMDAHRRLDFNPVIAVSLSVSFRITAVTVLFGASREEKRGRGATEEKGEMPKVV